MPSSPVAQPRPALPGSPLRVVSVAAPRWTLRGSREAGRHRRALKRRQLMPMGSPAGRPSRSLVIELAAAPMEGAGDQPALAAAARRHVPAHPPGPSVPRLDCPTRRRAPRAHQGLAGASVGDAEHLVRQRAAVGAAHCVAGNALVCHVSELVVVRVPHSGEKLVPHVDPLYFGPAKCSPMASTATCNTSNCFLTSASNSSTPLSRRVPSSSRA